MRNIDIPGAKEIFAKQDELMNTFWCNRGSIKALLIIHEECKKDYVSNKMLKMRGKNRINMCNEIYEKLCKEYYSKHSTVGDF